MAKAMRANNVDYGLGTCNDHVHPIPVTVFFDVGSGSTVVVIGSEGIVRVTDVGYATCGHTTMAVTGSSNVIVEGKGVHRVGDTGTIGVSGGTYTVQTGSPDLEVA